MTISLLYIKNFHTPKRISVNIVKFYSPVIKRSFLAYKKAKFQLFFQLEYCFLNQNLFGKIIQLAIKGIIRRRRTVGLFFWDITVFKNFYALRFLISWLDREWKTKKRELKAFLWKLWLPVSSQKLVPKFVDQLFIYCFGLKLLYAFMFSWYKKVNND